MRTITVPLKKLPMLFRKYGTESRVMTGRGLGQMVERAKHIVTVETLNAAPASARGGVGAVATGKYLKKWKITRAVMNGIRGVLITNSAEYMAIIERGRRAGSRMPPIDAIASWAQVRLGLPYKDARRAAWPIARAIARRGLYARRVMTGNHAMNSYRTNMKDVMGVALDQASIKVFS